MACLNEEEILEYLYSLPENEDDSEEECDEDAAEELTRLEVTNSGCDESDGSFAAAVDISQEGTEPDHQSNDNSEDESEWGDSVSYFERITRALDQNPVICPDLTQEDSEVDCLLSFLTGEILEIIRDQTNLYATQERERRLGGKVVRVASCNWKPTTVEEIKTFIVVHIMMGIHTLPELRHYWSSDNLLGVPAVANLITKTRFEKLTENIHCNDNTKAVPRGEAGYDRLQKLRPVINALNSRLKEVHIPSNVMAVDESMVPLRDRSSMKQYVPMKPVKRGYKVWCLAESRTGFVRLFDIYSGRSDTQGHSSFSFGEREVLSLCDTYIHSHRLIAFDNFFTSYQLLKSLNERGLYTVRTVRGSRKGLLDILNRNDRMQRGEFMFRTKGYVAAIKWQDTKPVTVLSMYHSPKHVTSVKRKNRDGTSSIIPCPAAVAQYNAIIGREDRFDQKRERYATGRRSLKWRHRLLYFLIDLAIVNNFIKRNCNNGGQRDQLSLRLALVGQLTVGREIKRRGSPDFLTKKTRRASAGYLTTCVYDKLGNICQLELQEDGADNAAQVRMRPAQALCAATARYFFVLTHTSRNSTDSNS